MNLVDHAKESGFVALGLSLSKKPPFYHAFCQWIDANKFGQMAWIKRHRDLRENPGTLLPGCQTVISLAYPYSPLKPRTPDGFTVARYCEPQRKDYHTRVGEKAKRLALTLKESYPDAKSRVCVDSAPILERSFAHRSGMGFVGKNNMLIVPGHGSYVFLAEILTTALLPGGQSEHMAEPMKEPMKDQCGNCTRCLDACPTGALEGSRRLNASRCLSYLTVEHAGDLDPKAGKRMDRCILGCDVCQEVCPFNPAEKAGKASLPGITEFLKMDEGTFKMRYGQTALSRPGLQRIKRNIKAVLT